MNNRDATIIEVLYEKHKNMMVSVAKNILRDDGLAEDAVHQAFIKVINNMEKIDFSDEVKIRGLLRIICKNIACDMYRSMKKINDCEDIDEIEIPENNISYFSSRPYDMLIMKETSQEIKEKIDKLPDIYKDVVELEYYHHYSLKEIAKLLNVSYETIKKRSLRARKMLEKELREEVVTNEEEHCKQGI